MKIRTVRTENEGSLSFIEAGKDIPFDIKRIYYIYDVPNGVKRGGHAHKTLKQFIFCPFGSVKIILFDGIQRYEKLLTTPEEGILVEGMVWREMIWQQDGSVLCVAASEYYDENDYVRDYTLFEEMLKNKL